MASLVTAIAVDPAALVAMFAWPDPTIAARLAPAYDRLFGKPRDTDGRTALFTDAAALLAGRPTDPARAWEDAFAVLCVHCGVLLESAAWERVNVDHVVAIETALREVADLPRHFLQTLLWSSPPPLRLPTASEGIVHLGWLSPTPISTDLTPISPSRRSSSVAG